MAIVGIKAEYDMRNLIEHPPAYVPHGIELYTTEQVREILIKFADSISVIADWDYNWEEELEIIGYNVVIGGVSVYGGDSMNEAVDEFMNGGNNEKHA